MSRIEDAVIKKFEDVYGHLRWAERVSRKIEQRAIDGFSSYGETLERDDLSDADWLDHIECEMLDALNYLEKKIDSTADPGKRWLLEEIQRNQMNILYMFETGFSAELIEADR